MQSFRNFGKYSDSDFGMNYKGKRCYFQHFFTLLFTMNICVPMLTNCLIFRLQRLPEFMKTYLYL